MGRGALAAFFGARNRQSRLRRNLRVAGSAESEKVSKDMVGPKNEDVLALAVPLIMQFEGFRVRPYLCTADKWTIGYGTTRYPDGTPVAPNDKEIGQAEAIEYLETAIARVDRALRPLLARTPSVQQYAALLSFAYNIGSGALVSSTLLAKFNAGDIAGASGEFLKWDKARVDGKLVCVPGLTRRRAAERQLFLGDRQ